MLGAVSIIYCVEILAQPNTCLLYVHISHWNIGCLCLDVIPYKCHHSSASVAFAQVLGVSRGADFMFGQDSFLEKGDVDIIVCKSLHEFC